MEKANRFCVQTLIKADEPTFNGRIYSKDLLKEICKMDFPEYGSCFHGYDRNFDIGTISHINHGLFIEDGILTGDIEVLETPHGKILKNVIQECGTESLFLNICFNASNMDDKENFKIISIVSLHISPRSDIHE